MTYLRNTGTLTVAALIFCSLMFVAPSASAAEVSVTIECDSNVDLYASPGDTINITFGAGCVNPDDGIYNSSAVDLLPLPNVAGFLGGPSVTPDGTFAGPTLWYVYKASFARFSAPLLGHRADDLSVALTPGTHVAQIFINDGAPYFFIVWRGSSAGGSRDLTIQQLAYGRGVDEKCREGYGPSWAQWPNSGTGGWVCVKNIYAYFPDLQIS